MADETREEYVARVSEEATKLGQDYRDAQRADAEKAREENPSQVETEEEYHERIRLASTTGIFGDLDTTAGADASATDVPSSNNEAATVAVAEVDAAAEEGDEEAAELSTDEARRQVDVAGVQPSAEEADAGAEEAEEDAADEDEAEEVEEDEAR